WSFVFSLGVLLEFIGRSLEHVGIPFAPMASSMLSVVVGVAGYLLWIRSNNASKAGKATEATEAAEAGTGTGDAASAAAAAAGSASKARNGLLIITLGATMLVASFMLTQLIPLVLG
ncbi:MAG: hypothetical protein LBS58_04610, partial [Coriobacteriales bacterium]|nr:hypothetical protein [Coriobacteriales bacterium]